MPSSDAVQGWTDLFREGFEDDRWNNHKDIGVWIKQIR